MMPITYILVLILMTNVNSQCLANLYNTNLTTDLIQLTQITYGVTLYHYTFKISFQSVPKIAIAITQLATNQNDALTNPFFYIISQNVTKGGIQIYTYSNNKKWVISKIGLIASHNNYLLIGSTTLIKQQNSKQVSGSTTSKLTFKIPIYTTLPVNNNQISRGFINGFSYSNKFTTISIVNTTYNKDGINFNVDVMGGGLQIVWVSYVVFNLNNGEFSAYGGYGVVNHNVSDTVDLLKGFSAVQNLFYGINTIQVNPQSNILGLQVDIDINFLMKYTSSSGNFVITYLFIGYSSSLTCGDCNKQSMGYYLNGMCVNQCTGNTIPIILANGGQICRGCPIGTGLIAVNGVCVCPTNLQFIKNRCVSSLEGLTVQMGQNLAIKAISSNGVSSSLSTSATNGVVKIDSAQDINQNQNFVLPLASSSQNIPQKMGISSSSSQNTVTSSGMQSSGSSNIQGVSTSSSSSSSSSFLPPLNPNPEQLPIGVSGQQNIPPILFGITSTSTYCPVPNSYFNGNQCVCKVSYVYQNGNCIIPQLTVTVVPFIYAPSNSNTTVISVKCHQNAYYNGNSCVCNQNYYLSNNICIKCQANSQWNGFSCICNNNYYNLNGQCIQQQISCPLNSVDNGLGTCICTTGYTMVNNQCITASITCPPNSTFINNACTCNKGFFNISGTCSQCPSGAFWSSQSNVCVYVCGVNSFYNTTLANCSCIPGFGISSSGSCQQCTNNYYLSNGYCVTCPINSLYSQNAKGCLCLSGFIISPQGICLQKCQANQIYNSLTTGCDCLVNYTRVSGICSACSSNSYYVNSQCINCPINSVVNNGQCICIAGYITNSFGSCVQCSSIANAFLINGFCAMCPNNLIYNNVSNKCQCPLGKALNQNICVASCNNDELLDSFGNCYSCGMNQVISNGVCTCRQGYKSNGCGGCDLVCGNGYFIFMGQCAICPMNTNYLEQIGGCVCPNGFYMNPISNICQRSAFVQPTCSSNAFYDTIGQKCTNCPSSCISCTSSNNCTSCQNGYKLSNGVCQSICGDGMVVGNQNCDSGSNYQAGCINCLIEAGYNCTGQPSVCFIIAPNPPLPPTPTPKPALSLKEKISLNSNNAFITLQTNPTFTFSDPTAMKNFMQYTFLNSVRPTTYCMQQANHLDTFDCLLIFSSGIPNKQFKVLFYYNYNGLAGNTTITIDPLKSLSTSKK